MFENKICEPSLQFRLRKTSNLNLNDYLVVSLSIIFTNLVELRAISKYIFITIIHVIVHWTTYIRPESTVALFTNTFIGRPW